MEKSTQFIIKSVIIGDLHMYTRTTRLLY